MHKDGPGVLQRPTEPLATELAPAPTQQTLAEIADMIGADGIAVCLGNPASDAVWALSHPEPDSLRSILDAFVPSADTPEEGAVVVHSGRDPALPDRFVVCARLALLEGGAAICGWFADNDPDAQSRAQVRVSAIARMLGWSASPCDAQTPLRVRQSLSDIIERAAFDIVFQPIIDLNTREVRGVEALARFSGEVGDSPELVIAEAMRAGVSAELDTVILQRALSQRDSLPRGCYVSVNIAPTSLLSPHFLDALGRYDGLGLILEITEHDKVPADPRVDNTLGLLRNRGIKIAFDDVGTGYSGLSQILRIRPDYLKLDMSLVSGLQEDSAKRSLASALYNFSREIGAKLIAEGIESEDEAFALRMLGISLGQGFHLGRPAGSDGPGRV